MTESTPLAAPALPRVVLAGRPNVGKSTLFNRLVGQRRALVHDRPGVTRDRLEGEVEWLGRRFALIDLAGLEEVLEAPAGHESGLAEAVREAAMAALANAALCLFVVDARQGPTASDHWLAQLLRRQGLSVIVVANKAEGRHYELASASFAELGLQPVMPVSAEHGDGTDELLEAVLERLPDSRPEPAASEADPELVELAIVGRPNVGKSQLFNKLLGQARSIVSPVAGTTRDPVDEIVTLGGRRIKLVDTAGLRRRGRVHDAPEALAVSQSIKRIERAHVVVLLLDASQEPAHQDAVIAGHVVESGRALVLAYNKWDLVADGKARREQLEHELSRMMKFLSWTPRVGLSALEGRGLPRLVRTICAVDDAHRLQVGTPELNRVVKQALQEAPLSTGKGAKARILYATQTGTRPPSFVFYLSRRARIHFSARRFVENRLRDALPLQGTPLRLRFRVG